MCPVDFVRNGIKLQGAIIITTSEEQMDIECLRKRTQHHQCNILIGNAYPESDHEKIADKSKMRNGLLEKRRL